MKQRYSYLDLKLIVNELEPQLKGSRLQNVYVAEASSRHFLFKFYSKSENRMFLIVDPGMRLHKTKFEHQTTLQPSGFVSKLRKHLRNLWISDMWVPKGSRLLVMTFGEDYYKLVFEFFAGGNIILLDKDSKILALVRVVKNMAGEITYGVGKHLEIHDRQMDPIQPADIDAIIGKEQIGRAVHAKMANASLSMVEYALEKHGVDPKKKQGDLQSIEAAIQECTEWFDRLVSEPLVPGYIMLDEKHQSQEFEPFRQYFEGEVSKKQGWTIEEFPSYNETVDEYYGAILAGKQESQFDQIHKVAETRLEAARNERQNRLKGLETVELTNEAMGTALQLHSDLVDQAIAAVNTLVNQGLDWGDIENIIEMEKARQNPIASHIDKLLLESGAMVLRLEGDEEQELKIKVKLAHGAWANARDYFEIRRAAGAKKTKTEQAAENALRSAEKKIKQDLEKSLAKSTAKTRTLNVRRSQFWFEKFLWFLSSDGYICIGGRDALQNELLLTRYFAKGDYYVHCDIDGASVVVIKNPEGRDVSPKALNECAAFSVATSRAWETKSAGVAWYTTRDKVPKLNKAGNPISVADVSNTVKRTQIMPNTFDVGYCIVWDTAGKIDSDEEIEIEEEDEEEFPDTELVSDEEFPDTELQSDDEQATDSSIELEQAAAEEELEEDEEEDEAEVESHEEPHEESQAESQAESEAESPEADTSLALSESPESSPAPVDVTTLPKRVRGNKKKLKKYMEQDEEDREAAMTRLGTLKGLERQEKERQEKQAQRQRDQEYKQQRQERARLADLKRINAEAVEETPFPRSLSLKASDNVKAALPMFGPWASMQGTELKVKVVPGQLKKGKASNEALRAMMDKVKDAQQKKLVEAIPSTDMQQIMPMSRVQIVGPAKSQAKGQAKKPARGQKKKK